MGTGALYTILSLGKITGLQQVIDRSKLAIRRGLRSTTRRDEEQRGK